MAAMVVALKTLFMVLSCTMAAALAYGIATDGYSSCFDQRARWTQAITTDVVIYLFLILAWYFYKESSWIKRVLFTIILFVCGSFVTCGYIAMLFFKLSPEESSKDPLYFVLASRYPKGDETRHTRRYSVVIAKVIVAVLGCCMMGLVIYAFIIDGFPFHMKFFTLCVRMAIIDDQIHIVVFSLWIAYKESSWINAFFWILPFFCFRSIAICIYVLQQLFYLSPEQPVYLILFNKSHRDKMLSDPLLMEDSNV